MSGDLPGRYAATADIHRGPSPRPRSLDAELTGAASSRLREFADSYPAYLRAWQDAISARLRG